jgi:hypothetical protein
MDLKKKVNLNSYPEKHSRDKQQLKITVSAF